MTLMPPDESLPTVGDRYVLVELIDGDDRREIWRGHDDLAGRRVLITRYLDAEAGWRTTFDRRARQLEALSDPGIASTFAHDAADDPPWLVAAFVEGETADVLSADLTADDALAVLGQAGLALATAHGAGVAHGRLDAAHIRVRPDGSVAVFDFAVDHVPTTDGDLAALTALAHSMLDDAAAESTDIASFVQLLDRGDWRDPADIGRTALALAAAERLHEPTAVAHQASDDVADEPEPPRPWYDEEERKQVRNRLIALGAIVVLGGAALLRIFNSGAGETSVPSVIGEPYVQAQHELNEVGLRTTETITSGPVGTEGTVVAQTPHGGQRVKIGSLVTLTVAATSAR